MSEGVKVVARNRKARHDYEILETVEAGLVLMGSEIKSIRAGRVNIAEGYVQYKNGELWLLNVHIATYDEAGQWGHEPLRPRKLLLHRKQIAQFYNRTRERGFTIIPLEIHLRDGRAKIELGLGRGKKKYDKRETLRKEDAKRQVERVLRGRN